MPKQPFAHPLHIQRHCAWPVRRVRNDLAGNQNRWDKEGTDGAHWMSAIGWMKERDTWRLVNAVNPQPVHPLFVGLGKFLGTAPGIPS